MREGAAQGAEVEAVTIGRKGRDWLLRFDPVLRSEFTGFPDNPNALHVGPVARG